jgi:hypothetical protein
MARQWLSDSLPFVGYIRSSVLINVIADPNRPIRGVGMQRKALSDPHAHCLIGYWPDALAEPNVTRPGAQQQIDSR